VLGNEPLLGVIPMEAMDLVVNPRLQLLTDVTQDKKCPRKTYRA
jgi:hypothetical protein